MNTNTTASLKEHMKKTHLELEDQCFKCDQCGMNIITSINLQDHMIMKHPDDFKTLVGASLYKGNLDS